MKAHKKMLTEITANGDTKKQTKIEIEMFFCFVFSLLLGFVRELCHKVKEQEHFWSNEQHRNFHTNFNLLVLLCFHSSMKRTTDIEHMFQPARWGKQTHTRIFIISPAEQLDRVVIVKQNFFQLHVTNSWSCFLLNF